MFIGVNDDKEIVGVNKNNLEAMKKNFVHVVRACLNFPEIMLDRLYRPVFIRHIVS
ncbi:hypothetical protein IR167_09310, partial [Bacteroides acidifaciens]|nr:hypothetical protein [Bacteroides acidifaciens]